MIFPFDFQILLNTVVTMFLLLIIGYLSRKFGYMTDAGSKFISNFIICVAQPFMIVGSVTGIPYSAENLNKGVYIIILGIAIHSVTAAIAFAAVFRMKDRDERQLAEYGMIFANCGFLGFPILRSMFGGVGVFWGAFYVVVFNVVAWTYGMFVLGKARREIKMNFVKMFLNYGTTPCIIGIVLFLLKIGFPAPLRSAVDYMGSLCTPLSMLVVGGLLAVVPVRRVFTELKVYYQCLIRLIVVPLVIISLCRLAGVGREMLLFASVMSALPTAANTAMFAERYDLKPGFAAHGVGMTTLLSSVTVPFIIYIAALISK